MMFISSLFNILFRFCAHTRLFENHYYKRYRVEVLSSIDFSCLEKNLSLLMHINYRENFLKYQIYKKQSV